MCFLKEWSWNTFFFQPWSYRFNTKEGFNNQWLADARPASYNEKNRLWNIWDRCFFSPPTQSLLFLSLPRWHTASQSPCQTPSVSLSVIFSPCRWVAHTSSHMARLHNIQQHIKLLMSLSSCKTSRNDHALICKMSSWNMLFVSSFGLSIYRLWKYDRPTVWGQKQHT